MDRKKKGRKPKSDADKYTIADAVSLMLARERSLSNLPAQFKDDNGVIHENPYSGAKLKWARLTPRPVGEVIGVVAQQFGVSRRTVQRFYDEFKDTFNKRMTNEICERLKQRNRLERSEKASCYRTFNNVARMYNQQAHQAYLARERGLPDDQAEAQARHYAEQLSKLLLDLPEFLPEKEKLKKR